MESEFRSARELRQFADDDPDLRGWLRAVRKSTNLARQERESDLRAEQRANRDTHYMSPQQMTRHLRVEHPGASRQAAEMGYVLYGNRAQRHLQHHLIAALSHTHPDIERKRERWEL